MLTRKQNLLETIRGGNPDRFVKQYEFMTLINNDPYELKYPDPVQGGPEVLTGWGVHRSWPEGLPGAFPIHTPESMIVCPDVAEWRKHVHMPETSFSDEEWEPAVKRAEAVDRDDQFVAAYIAPGIFEQCHYLCEMQATMMNFYEEPEAMAELINYIADWEVEYAKDFCKHVHPDALFHHDDWGSQISTFIAPAMFEEYILPAYKRVYGTYKDLGVELIVHHSDSYAATLVPYMIEMGIDIWQGVMRTNDINKLIETYGGQISFMGGVDSALVDYPGWTPEAVEKVVSETLEMYGQSKHYFIPCQSQGWSISTFPGVYECIDENIDKMSAKMFK